MSLGLELRLLVDVNDLLLQSCFEIQRLMLNSCYFQSKKMASDIWVLLWQSKSRS